MGPPHIELDASDDPGAYYPISAVSALLDEYYQFEADSEGSVDWEFLSDSIPMSEPSGWGGFVDMHNDIAAVTPLLDENSDPLLLLGVAEAATIAALGSFIQGFMSEGDLDQSYRILLKAQDWAGEEAVERLTGVAKMQAAVLTSRYIEEFRPHYAEILFTAAQSGITLPRLEIPKDQNGFHSVQSVLRLLDPDRFA